MALGTKAKQRGAVVDTLANLKFSGSNASNQVQFTQPKIKAMGPGANRSNQQQSRTNDKGTGRVGIESSIALSGKRKINIKLPANF